MIATKIAAVGNSESRAAPEISVRNLQRTVRVDTVDLKKFAAKALRMCLQLRKDRATDLAKLRELFVLLVSDRRIPRCIGAFFTNPDRRTC